MIASYNRKSILWGALGILLLMIGGVLAFLNGFAMDPQQARLSTGVLYAGAAAIVVAFCLYAKAKGRNPAWGLLSLVFFFPLKDISDDEHRRPPS